MEPLGQYPDPVHVVAHLSDPHLLADALQYGVVDTAARLEAALVRLGRLPTPPQALVFTGDLAGKKTGGSCAEVEGEQGHGGHHGNKHDPEVKGEQATVVPTQVEAGLAGGPTGSRSGGAGSLPLWALSLGAGLFLAQQAEAGLLPGRVRLLFQPAEETPGGALDVMAAGGITGVDRAFALHCDPRIEVGELGLRSGPITAACDKVYVKVTGPVNALEGGV